MSQEEEGRREIQTDRDKDRETLCIENSYKTISKRSLLLSHNIKMPTVGKKSWKFIHREVIHGKKSQLELELTASTLLVRF